MYKKTPLTDSISDLKKIKIGLVNTAEGMIYWINEGLHEQLAREICEGKGYDWECAGKYVSAVDYLLEKENYIKLSNYGQGSAFRCITASRDTYIKSKILREWFEILVNSLKLREDLY